MVERHSPVNSNKSYANVGFVSLGCPKALVDSERLMTQLKIQGYDIVGDYEGADIVVVNTCGFIDSAKAESLEAIGEALNENGKVIVTGCLGKDAQSILKQYPKVLSVSGPQQYETVVSAIRRHAPIAKPAYDPHLSLIPDHGVKLTPPHYAYLKISEGCNHQCRFCIIPDLRGKLVSRPIDDVLREAEQLARSGVKELLIISQDTSAYGVDLKYQTAQWRNRQLRTHLLDLCEGLGELGIWIRLHYIYPYPHVDKIIPLMAERKILPYLDIPFQHGDPTVLKNMRRPAHAENTLKRIQRWREICPDLTLRSTFIVGFPGETQAQFNTLLDFLSQAQLDRVGCFQYSPVEGAKANQLPDPVSEEVKQERWEILMSHQQKISTAKLQSKVGRTVKVLIDEIDQEGSIGRSMGDAPGIDGLVYLNGHYDCSPGDWVNVKIEHADEYDLWGMPINGGGKNTASDTRLDVHTQLISLRGQDRIDPPGKTFVTDETGF